MKKMFTRNQVERMIEQAYADACDELRCLYIPNAHPAALVRKSMYEQLYALDDQEWEAKNRQSA